MKVLGGILVVVLVGCGGGVDAKQACDTLVKGGFGTNCTEGKPKGLGSAAWQVYSYDLADPKGEKCNVMAFKTSADYDATVKAFEGAAVLAGPHRYGNPRARVFVQCNDGMPRTKGTELEAAVGKL